MARISHHSSTLRCIFLARHRDVKEGVRLPDAYVSYGLKSEAMQIKFAGRTFTLGSPRASKHGRSKKWPPRKRFMCGFLVSMVLVLAAFAFQLLSFKNVSE